MAHGAIRALLISKIPHRMEATPSCALGCIFLLSDLLLTPNSFCFEDSFFSFLLLLLIFSPHINYINVLGAMCFATSQRKPQDFRSEELPDVLAWQNTTRGSWLRLPDWAGCLGKTGWGHHLLPESGTTEEMLSVFGYFPPPQVDALTVLSFLGWSCLSILRLNSILFPDKPFASWSLCSFRSRIETSRTVPAWARVLFVCGSHCSYACISLLVCQYKVLKTRAWK